MKTAGIIAEYNPFHNGHQYHIEETRKRTGADYVIAAISGDYVQRGAPAVLDKYTRTRMALSCGADMVFELPVTTALSSAEGFASGGVSLLSGLGVVDVISCGCESAGENPELFSLVVSLISKDDPHSFLNNRNNLYFDTKKENENITYSQTENNTKLLSSEEDSNIKKYKTVLRDNLKKGFSFPSARQIAVEQVLGADAAALLSHPNDVLATEYAKAIKNSGNDIELCLIPRQGEGHHSENINCVHYSSASALRNLLFSDDDNMYESLKTNVPTAVYPILVEAKTRHMFLKEDDFTEMLYHALLMNRDLLPDFGPADSGLTSRTANLLEQFTTWSDFTSLLKTKNQTYTAISRYLARIMLGISRYDIDLSREISAPYTRLLGFKKCAAPLLSAVKANSSIPILIRMADDTGTLRPDAKHLFDIDVRSSEIYRQMQFSKSGQFTKPELRQAVITV